MDAQIDAMPVSSLDTRYGVHRSQVYNRLDAIKRRRSDLVPFRQGRKSYVNAELLSLLDGMAALIQQGSTNEDAAEQVLGKLSTRPADSRLDSLPDIRQVDDSALAISNPQPATEPFDTKSFLEKLRTLQELSDNEWLPGSSELTAILGLQTLPSGPSFERYGFLFKKAGRNGQESAWKIEKLKV